MKTTTICIFLLILSVTTEISAKKSVITLHSLSAGSVRIKKPIDGNFNFNFVSDKVELKANQYLHYDLEVDDFCSVQCEFSNGNICSFSLLEGDSIQINNAGDRVTVKGDNAAGTQYLIDNYWVPGLFLPLEKTTRIFKRHINNGIDFNGFDKEYGDSIQSAYTKDIEQMTQAGQISNRFAEVMAQNLQNAHSLVLITMYKKVLRGKEFNYQPSAADSLAIMERMDNLYRQNLTLSRPFAYYYTFPYDTYLQLKYKALNTVEKEKLLTSYDKEAFGSYSYFLLVPERIQLPLLGDKCIEQLQFRYNYFDTGKLLAYLKQKFPNSEYEKIITDIIQAQRKQDQAKAVEKTVLESNKIRTLCDLSQVPDLQKDYIFIDLWATWCMPCIHEFQYKDELHGLLVKYGNIIPVYVSVDEENKTELWKKSIENFQLNGYHLRASETLLTEIKDKIFVGKGISIPRFILLSPEGTIVDGNLPRPSRLNALEESLNHYLKK
ncbi:MAG: hypothetical protein Q8861_03100 [Bacteroidota bacterium]|nr:hypothetical protein [Bacteroidota bacterium]